MIKDKKRKGHKLSDETKAKISKSNKARVGGNGRKGKKLSQETKDKIGLSNKGKRYKQNITQEQRDKLSQKMSGSKNPLWKGGVMKDRKYVSWLKNKRNRVIKRLKIESLSHTYGEWELLKKQYNYTCPCCHKSEPEIKLTEDHIIPISKGGSDLIENIQPLCLSCNVKKNSLIIKY